MFKYLLPLILLTSCNGDSENQKEVKGTKLEKSETILANASEVKNISLNNNVGEVIVVNGEKPQATFVKKEWRDWCILSHKEESATIKIKVENTSFTGDGGCKLEWTLTLPVDGVLNLKMAAGSIKGEGKFSALKVQLAAGNLYWKDGNGPVEIQVAAGAINFENLQFPKSGSSSIEVGTGQVKISSPKDNLVTTSFEKALGAASNDFSKEVEGHKLKVQVAVGQISHKSLP